MNYLFPKEGFYTNFLRKVPPCLLPIQLEQSANPPAISAKLLPASANPSVISATLSVESTKPPPTSAKPPLSHMPRPYLAHTRRRGLMSQVQILGLAPKVLSDKWNCRAAFFGVMRRWKNFTFEYKSQSNGARATVRVKCQYKNSLLKL